MRRQVATILCAGFVCVSTAALFASLSHAQSPKSSNGQVFSTIKDLMQSIVDPSADDLWNAVRTDVDREGIHETVPHTPDDWLDVRHAAVRLIEAGNLLMMPGRDAAPPDAKSDAPGVELEPPQIAALIDHNRASFDGFAKALQALGAEAVRASDAHDANGLLDIGARMETVCESCHQTFWYPPPQRNAP